MQDVKDNLIEALYLVEREMDKHEAHLGALKEQAIELKKHLDADPRERTGNENKAGDTHLLAEQIALMIADCERLQITERVSCMLPFGRRHLELSVKIKADDGGRIKITEIV